MNLNWKAYFATLILVTTPIVNANSMENAPQLVLENCHVNGIRQQVRCGKLDVPENYSNENGTQISINVVVLPAIDNSKNKTPLMFLAGGPGQAATELAAQMYTGFTEIRKTRDLILIDQRGTGDSHPLQCDDELELDQYAIIPEDLDLADIEKCIAKLSGDLSQYNSENAIRDFDAVRAALGHNKVNLYGGSYGTRAGLVYMRLFPNTIESVVLDSVGPIEVPIGLFGQSAARSFSLLIENCQLDTECLHAYPELEQEFKTVKEQLSKGPVTVNIMHPTLGNNTRFVISLDKFISTLQMQLYSTETRSLVPLIIHQAAQGNFNPLAGLIAQSEGGMGIYLGLHFNIVCNEDIPKITTTMKQQDAQNTFAQDMSLRTVEKVCSVWPTYQPSKEFYQTVSADIPTLILSGNLDPVTPPSNGDKALASLPNSHHIISKNNAHIVASTQCGVSIVNEFLETKKPTDLDEACLEEIPNVLFMSGLNGGVASIQGTK